MLGRCSTLLWLTAVAGCGTDERVDGRFTAQEWEFLQSFRLPALDPCPPDVGMAALRCDGAAELGQDLFFDRSYAGPIVIAADGTNGGLGPAGATGLIACSDCHMPDAWFADQRSKPNATSLGSNWTRRNAQSLVNVGYQQQYTWDGTYPTLADVLAAPLEKPALLNSSPRRLAEVIQQDHRALYEGVFAHALEGELGAVDVLRVRDNAAIAIALYERRLVSGQSAFDQYLDGDVAAISEEAKRGLVLFIGPALCSECHNGPLLGDGRYRTTGVTQHRAGAATAHVPAEDLGRAAFTHDPADEGRFRTPGLRHIAETAPYMHAGQIATLREVVEFYRWGGDDAGFAGRKDALMLPLELSDDDAADLVAFMRTLTGEPIAEELRR